MYVSKIGGHPNKVKKTKDPGSTALKKITTLVKVEILARTWKQKKWDQDADKTGIALISGIQ